MVGFIFVVVCQETQLLWWSCYDWVYCRSSVNKICGGITFTGGCGG